MRFIAAINTRIYGRYYAQGGEIDTLGWSRKQMLQFLNLGLIQASQITAGMITDAIVFEGAGVTTTTNADGQLVVIIEEVPLALSDLTDVEVLEGLTADGSVLAFDWESSQWKPTGLGELTSPIYLHDLVDVGEMFAEDGNVLLFDAGIGLWQPGVMATTMAALEDVDVAGIADGQTVIWDNSEEMFVPGTPLGAPGPPGPAAWATPVPWTSSLNAVIGPPATVVTYAGSSYVAIAPSTNQSPTNIAYWRLIASKGAQGDEGDPGPASTIPGPPGEDGADGEDGTDGVGVPVGGTIGQALLKASSTNYDTLWGDVEAGGGGGGPGLWRGAWSTLSLEDTLDLYPVPGALTVTNIAGTIPSGGIAATGTGNPGGTVLRLGSAGPGGFSTDLAKAEITVPAGIVKMRVYAAVEGGFWGNACRILNDGVNVWNTVIGWGWIELTVSAGDVMTFENYLTGNGNSGTFLLDRLEWMAPVDPPYNTGEYVTHLNRIWVSDADNNSGVPGTAGWTRWDLLVDTNDVDQLTEAIQDIVAAMVVAGTNVTKTYDDSAGTLTIASTASGGGGGYAGDWNSATAYTTGQEVSSAGALWAAKSNNTNVVPSSTVTYTSAGSDCSSALLQEGRNQVIHKFKLNADTLVGALQFGTVAPGYLNENVSFYLTTQIVTNGSTVDPSQLTTSKTAVPTPGGTSSNIYWNRLYLDSPIMLTAGVEYALVFYSAVGAGFASTLALNPTPAYSGVMVAPTTTAEDLYRSSPGGAWTVQAAGRRTPVSILSASPVTWERIAVEDVAAGDVTGLVETTQDIVGAMVVAGANITKVYDDTAGTLTLASTGGGGGGAAYTMRGEWGVAPAGALAVMRQAIIGAQMTAIPASDASLVVSTTPVTSDVLVFHAVTGTSSNVTGVSGCGATWSKIGSDYTGVSVYSEWWIGVNPSSAGAITVTRAAARNGSHRAWLIGGLSPATPLITQASIGASGSTFTGTPVNAQAGQMVIQSVYGGSITDFVYPNPSVPAAGWTTQAIYQTGSLGSVNSAYRAPSELAPTAHNATATRSSGVTSFMIENLVLGAAASVSSSYLENDTVTHEGRLYQCAVAGTSAEPGMDGDWVELPIAQHELWRGPWASMSVVSAYDLTTVPAGWTNVGGWTSVVTPTARASNIGGGSIPGTPPTSARVLQNPVNNTTEYLEFTIPTTSATHLRVVTTLSSGHVSYSRVFVNKNGVAFLASVFQNGWLEVVVPVVAGDVIQLGDSDVAGFSTIGNFGQIELVASTNPYMLGDTVTYANRVWRSAIDNNGTVPGADTNWAEEVLFVDPADIVGSSTVGRAVLVAVDAAAARAAIGYADSNDFSWTGMISAALGTQRLYNDSGRTRTLTKARASVGTAPAGGPLTVDINVGGTTAFATKPSIAAGANTATATPSAPAWADGAYLTVDVDLVGTTTPGSDLVVTISWTE